MALAGMLTRSVSPGSSSAALRGERYSAVTCAHLAPEKLSSVASRVELEIPKCVGGAYQTGITLFKIHREAGMACRPRNANVTAVACPVRKLVD